MLDVSDYAIIGDYHKPAVDRNPHQKPLNTYRAARRHRSPTPPVNSFFVQPIATCYEHPLHTHSPHRQQAGYIQSECGLQIVCMGLIWLIGLIGHYWVKYRVIYGLGSSV